MQKAWEIQTRLTVLRGDCHPLKQCFSNFVHLHHGHLSACLKCTYLDHTSDQLSRNSRSNFALSGV